MPALYWENADGPEISHSAVALKIGSETGGVQEVGHEGGWLDLHT